MWSMRKFRMDDPIGFAVIVAIVIAGLAKAENGHRRSRPLQPGCQ